MIKSLGKMRALGPTIRTDEKNYSGGGGGGAQARPDLDQSERKVYSRKKGINK